MHGRRQLLVGLLVDLTRASDPRKGMFGHLRHQTQAGGAVPHA